ncbi:MAG: diaminopimelate decarboxylase [Anaerolineales bacterium]|nr:diaminopimelate decarboxylase [Anaerolineales bacterium]
MTKRLDLFPLSTKIQNDRLFVANCDLTQLAERFGTPLYLYDRLTLDSAAKEYRSALDKFYPAASSVTYAGKAFLCKAIVRWALTHDFALDCTGAGEIAIAAVAGAKKENILVHGVNKSDEDLQSAFQFASVVVVDNLDELRRIRELIAENIPDLWLRFLPGVSVSTHHAYTQTGHHESKFGMTDDEILAAATFCRENNLPLKGIHFHQGSNFRDAKPLLPAIDSALDLAQKINFREEWHFCPGGGWGAAYHEDEAPHPRIEDYVRGIAAAVVAGCARRNLPLPRLRLEPGRSLVARSGVALYRVGAVKRRGEKVWALIDGGMADNPRFALYGAKYSCLTVSSPNQERDERVSFAGPYCESGDILIEDLPMPNIQRGDLIAVPVSGAYQLSMASNYNGARRPAAIWLDDGNAVEILRRESASDLLDRD